MGRFERTQRMKVAFSNGLRIAVADWNETDHPRDDNGRFGDGGGAVVRENLGANKVDPSPTNHEVPKDLQDRVSIRIGDRVSVDKPGVYQMSSTALEYNLKNGSFSVVTAANPDSQQQPQAVNDRLMGDLRIELAENGAIFHEVEGIYAGNYEPSFLVHHLGRVTPELIESLGVKYNQTSVMHYTKGETTFKYTSGDQMGQSEKLNGYTVKPAADAPQTVVPGGGKFAVGSEKPKFGFVIKTDDNKTHQVILGNK